jgi:DNA-directed RNA polymerase subunit RPC12/RpoP
MAVAKITCPECKKSFKGRDDLEGKRIRCPGCGTSFVVKGDDADDAAAALLMAGDSGPAPPRPSLDDDDDNDPNPYGVSTIKLGARCPNCANEMESEDAVICLYCGYNVQTRKIGQTKKVLETTGGDWAEWTLPGILNAGGILVLCLLHICWIIWTSVQWRYSEMWLWYITASEAFRMWMTFFLLGGLWAMGVFAYKRLIVETTPPEKELD